MSTKELILIFTVAFSLSLMSCRDVLKSPYSKKTAEGDLERIKAISQLDSAEFKLLTDFMLTKGLIDADLLYVDTDYRDLLEKAKANKEKTDKAKEIAQKMRDNKDQFVSHHADTLNNFIKMLPEKSSIRKDWSNKNAVFYTMVFSNISTKTIRAFKGKFTFYDIFHTELKTMALSYNDTIPPGKEVVYTSNLDFNDVTANTIYMTKDYSDIKVGWNPDKILFTDGEYVE
ncbi:MAG: hypothetical protein NW207_03185 [Cytophagales bacterium]|nr:hypothetical protein [Cytophagales bacterium]